MDLTLLTKVGMVVGWISNGGYLLAGGIFLKSAVQYFKDYKSFNEKGGI